MAYTNFMMVIREDVHDALHHLKKNTRVPMAVHAEQFIIDGLKKYGIKVPDYQPDAIDQDRADG